MPSNILKEMFKTIDHFNLLAHKMASFYLQCLMDMEVSLAYFYLQYINDPITDWWVCLGVPYGIVFWQVSDSKEQNSPFIMTMMDTKRQLLVLKREHF